MIQHSRLEWNFKLTLTCFFWKEDNQSDASKATSNDSDKAERLIPGAENQVSQYPPGCESIITCLISFWKEYNDTDASGSDDNSEEEEEDEEDEEDEEEEEGGEEDGWYV